MPNFADLGRTIAVLGGALALCRAEALPLSSLGAPPAVPTAAPHTLAVTNRDNGKVFTLRAGDTLRVSLPDRGPGGETWYVLWDPHDPLLGPPSRLELGPGAIVSKKSTVSMSVFSFRALGGGPASSRTEWLRFQSLKPTDKNTAHATLVQFQITVPAAPKDFLPTDPVPVLAPPEPVTPPVSIPPTDPVPDPGLNDPGDSTMMPTIEGDGGSDPMTPKPPDPDGIPAVGKGKE